MHKLLAVLPLAAGLTACSIEIRDARPPVDMAQECFGDKGACIVTDHGRIEHVKPLANDEQIHAAILAHPEWVRDAILADPQVIADAQASLAQRQMASRQAAAKKALADNHDAVFADPADPVIGNPSGDVTLVEFFDNECPFCKQIAPAIEELVTADPKVRVVMKEFPILGPMSETAARYALAGKRQGKYAAFHAALMADKTPEHQLAEPRILEIAGQVGLDVVRLKTDAAAPEIAAKIAANRALAAKLAITGTPGLIIGDRVTSGAMSLDALKSAVAEARHQKLASAR